MSIEVDIKKRFGDFKLDISFKADNEIVALWGASGVGKSTTLKCIAGIEKPDEGRIVLDGNVLFDSQKKINVKTQLRKVGYMFQDYALFPNMTVYQNIAITGADKVHVDEYIQKFKLEGLEKLYPYQLSGGQKQRTAMARMLITNPSLVMFDEPFNALDSELKKELRTEVKEILKSTNRTTIIVSHDMDEVRFFTENIIKFN